MDIEIPREIILKRKRTNISIWTAAFIAVVLVLYGFYHFISPSVKSSSILTGIAETGNIEATVSASGIVVPLYEQVITSPIEAKIEKVLHFSGENVSPGDPILLLNKEFSIIALEKLKDEYQLKKNRINKEKLNLEKAVNELEASLEIQLLKIESLSASYEDEKKLIKIGGTTEDKLKQAQLNLKVAEQEMSLTKKQISNLKSSMITDLEALEIEIRIQKKSIEELERKIEQAEVKATTEGVVTFVNGNIGANVNPGDQLVKLADLSKFKIEGTISEAYGSYISTGQKVIIKYQKEELRGVVSKIEPSVANGIIKFTVELEEKNHASLRPNLKVDVYLVTAFKENVVRVKKGNFYKGSKDQKVFIIKDGVAYKKLVNIGESNFDWVELENGIVPGDQVIISDMSDYHHMNKVEIK